MSTYFCPCCHQKGVFSAADCRCVFALCQRCSECLTHCQCLERRARECEVERELDAPGGPFYGLADRIAR